MANERICPCCDKLFIGKERRQKYCSNQCRLDALHQSTYGKRLHDGMRLLSDDFGELRGDEFVTFQ